jgi:hypothetical protein
VERLWNLWLEIVTPSLGEASALASKPTFLARLDPRLSFEDNRRLIEFEARRFIEAITFRPFVPLARRPLIHPGIEEAIRLAGGPGLPPEVQAGLAPPGVGLWELPRRFPAEFERFLREEVGMEPDEFRFMSLREQLTILRAFRGWLSRQGILP